MHKPSTVTLPAPDAGLEKLMSIDEAARILSVSRATVIRLADAGDLSEARIGSRRLFAPDAVRQYIADATAAAEKRRIERQQKAAERAKAKEIVSRK